MNQSEIITILKKAASNEMKTVSESQSHSIVNAETNVTKNLSALVQGGIFSDSNKAGETEDLKPKSTQLTAPDFKR